MNTLKDIRSQIDSVDAKIIALLVERVHLVKDIGKVKKEQSIKAFDPKRWKEVLHSRKELAKSLDIAPEMIEKIWHIIHDYSLQREQES